MGLILGMPAVIKQAIPDVTAATAGTLMGSGGNATANLSWTEGTGAYGVKNYKVWQDNVVIATVDGSTLSYQVTGLTNGTEYDFNVSTVDMKNLESAKSNTVSLTPASIAPGLYLLITVPQQNDATWTLRTADIADYVGHDCRLVIAHKLPSSGSNYTADVQVDDMKLGSTFWDPEAGTNSFERASNLAVNLEYANVTWEALATGTTQGRWNRDDGGTPSSSTGNTSGHTGNYYFYTEVSSNYTADYVYWLRSPTVSVDTNTLEVYTAQNGATCGEIRIYLDVLT